MSAKCTITAQSSVNCQQHQPVHKLWLLRLRLQPELQVLLAMAALCRGRDTNLLVLYNACQLWQLAHSCYSAAALLAMQSAVITTAIPSVRLSHVRIVYPDE